MTDIRLYIELLVARKKELLSELAAVGTSLARVREIGQSLEKVCQQLQFHGHSGRRQTIASLAPSDLPSPSTIFRSSRGSPITLLGEDREIESSSPRDTPALQKTPSKPRRTTESSDITPSPADRRQVASHADNISETSSYEDSNDFFAAHEGRTTLTEDHLPIACPNSKYSHVVLFNGKPYELVCYICNANSNTSGKYFNGARGLRMHVNQHPQEKGRSTGEILERAIKSLRRVDDEDFERIKVGKEPFGLGAQFSGRKYFGDSRLRAQRVADVFAGPSSNAHVTPQFDQLDPVRYPTIVLLDGAWYEIWCYKCGANVCADPDRSNYGEFLMGMPGLHSHIRKTHMIKPEDRAFGEVEGFEVARLCDKRKLSEDDVRRIRAGQTPKTKIKKYIAWGEAFGEGKQEPQRTRGFLDDTYAPSSSEKDPASNSLHVARDTSGNGNAAPPSIQSAPKKATPSRPKKGVASYRKRARSPSQDSLASSHPSSGTSIPDIPLTQHEKFKKIRKDAKQGRDYLTERTKRRKYSVPSYFSNVDRHGTAFGDEEDEEF